MSMRMAGTIAAGMGLAGLGIGTAQHLFRDDESREQAIVISEGLRDGVARGKIAPAQVRELVAGGTLPPDAVEMMGSWIDLSGAAPAPAAPPQASVVPL